MATKLDRMLTSLNRLLPKVSHESFIACSYEIYCSLTRGGSARERLICHLLLGIILLATEEEVCILWNMFCEIKSIVFEIKVLTVLLLCGSFWTVSLISHPGDIKEVCHKDWKMGLYKSGQARACFCWITEKSQTIQLQISFHDDYLSVDFFQRCKFCHI